MEETILYPSPNWFLPSIIGVSIDGWLVYGGPGKTLVVLEPLSPELDGVLDSDHRYKPHVVIKSHKEKIVTVDITPEWPEKRTFVSGSSDGTVKEWTITQADNTLAIKNTRSHEGHANEKEEVVGVGYSTATHVISVGSFANIVVWELNTNVTQTYNNFMRSFKATCMSCSPHTPMVVAVGTKQGVIFVLDLNGRGKVIYKVRGQDDEIAQVVWCPQYEVILKRSLEEVKKSAATLRMERIRNEPQPAAFNTSAVEKKLPEDSFGPEPTNSSALEEKLDENSLAKPTDPNTLAKGKELPQDSFDESIVVEDDMFDIYKDHEVEEFGHKKFQPRDILVKEKDETVKDDFLVECEKLKAQILKSKEEDEKSIETLVAAMDKANVEDATETKKYEEAKTVSGAAVLSASGTKLVHVDESAHVHKHLLASISKNGYSVRIWSKTGKIVASCAVLVNPKGNNKQFVNKSPHHASLCWYKPDSLLIADGKTNLVMCNPLQVDYRNRLIWSVVHSAHRRGLFTVASGAPRVQRPAAGARGDWPVWTAAQDRYLIKYDMNTRKVLAKFGTTGGYLYNVTCCPYDAGKVAVGVGDGAVRVWESRPSGEEDTKLALGEVACYWQNVQGKILQCAWHPTRENLLAFSTAESRVGLIDVGKADRPAKVLPTALTHGVYSLAWGDDMTLFAVGGKELVMYQADKIDKSAPIPIHIEIEGQKWEPSVVNYSWRGLAVASTAGGVAVFSGPGGLALAAKFVTTRMIQAMEWHPLQTSSSDEESKYKNLMAIATVDRANPIIHIIHYEDKEGGGKQFTEFDTLSGHSDTVLQVYWSPHRDGQILSTSVDTTVRVWDAIRGVCVSIFNGHSMGTLGAAWCAPPHLMDKVMSGGTDYCLRLWDINHHPAEEYKEVKRAPRKRNKRPNQKPTTSDDADDIDKELDEDSESIKTEADVQTNCEGENGKLDEDVACDAANLSNKGTKAPKRFLLPILSKQFSRVNIHGLRVVLHKYLAKNGPIKHILDIAKDGNADLYDLDFLKLFGTINDVNEVLDMECKIHLERKSYKEYIMLMIFRGHIDAVIQFANEHDLLDLFLLSIAPCVSYKYWKDVVQLYVAQIDRMTIKKQQDENAAGPNVDVRDVTGHGYGGAVYRKVGALLSVHDVRGALDVLERAGLYKEAYVLCRCRHMDSLADEILHKWQEHLAYTGNLTVAAFINIAMGNIHKATSILRRSTEQENLNLAADLAKSAGLNTFADFIETKVKTVENEPETEDQTEEHLAELPTKMELLMRENKIQNGESNIEKPITEEKLVVSPNKIELMKGRTIQNGESTVVDDLAKVENGNPNEALID